MLARMYERRLKGCADSGDAFELAFEVVRESELERLVGQLTAENRFFKGALQRIKEVRIQSSLWRSTRLSDASKRINSGLK